MNSKNKIFAFDVGITFIASIINIIILLPINIILGRYLGATELGLYQMVFTIYNFAMLILTAGIPIAMINFVSKNKDETTKVNYIITSGVFTSIFLGMLSMCLFFLISDILANIFNMPELSQLIKIISFAFPFSVTGNTLLAVLNGFRRMKEYAIAGIIQSVLMLFVTILLLYFKFGVISTAIGIVVSYIVFWSYLVKRTHRFIVKVHLSEAILYSKKMFSFGYKNVIGDSMSLINYQADTLMVGYFLNTNSVGFYGVATSFAKFLWLIPSAIQKITYPLISEYHGKQMDENIREVIPKIMKYTVCISLLVALIMRIYSKEVITLVFGNQFIHSVMPFNILIVGSVIFSSIKCINSFFASIGRVDLSAKIPSISAVFNIFLNILLIPIYGINGAAIATTISLLIYVLATLYYMKKLSGIVYDFLWYIKAFMLMIFLYVINKILLFSININISAIITVIFGVFFIWVYLLTSNDRRALLEIIS